MIYGAGEAFESLNIQFASEKRELGKSFFGEVTWLGGSGMEVVLRKKLLVLEKNQLFASSLGKDYMFVKILVDLRENWRSYT